MQQVPQSGETDWQAVAHRIEGGDEQAYSERRIEGADIGQEMRIKRRKVRDVGEEPARREKGQREGDEMASTDKRCGDLSRANFRPPVGD